MSTTIKQPHQKELFGQPIGLYILFLTEMWERFSYYGMRALLVLYMTTATIGDDRGAGLGWTSKEALALYGWYTMLVYVMSIPVLMNAINQPSASRLSWQFVTAHESKYLKPFRSA